MLSHWTILNVHITDDKGLEKSIAVVLKSEDDSNKC